jgi:glycosyltransferase involved in cell wall biosynthesis
VLGLPRDASIVLVAAPHFHAPRKGGRLAVEALRRLEGRASPFVLVAGAAGDELLRELRFDGKAVGRLEDDVSLALVYQAADAFVSPSVADAGPMMVPEALLCGTPVVAFELGYAADLVRAPETGALAPIEDVDALADGLLRTLARGDAAACRAAAEGFEARTVAAAHAALYESLLEPARAAA